MTRLLAFVRRLLLACAAAGVLSVLLPASAWAASCGPATGQGSAPTDFRTYCWLDLSGYVDATARGTNGQAFTFNLPDGTTVNFTLKSDGALNPAAVPSWTGSAFGNSAFTGIPGKPILYQTANGTTVNVTISNIVVTPPSGGTSQYSMIVGDGESTNGGETLAFTTTGNAWQRVATIKNGTSNLYPTVSGEGTNTVTETGVDGTVGSFVWRSDGNPSQISSTLKGSGLQGIIIGMRYASISVVSQLTNARYKTADQFVYSLTTTTGMSLATGTTTGTATSGFPVASVPTVAASYPFNISEAMAPGSIGTLQNYLTTLTCTNTNGGSSTQLPSNLPVTTYNFTNLQYGDAVLCTFTNTTLSNRVSGTVYSDANHNGSQDGTESGTGVSGLYVKLAPSSGGTCGTPVNQSAAVDPVTGAYTIVNPAAGTWCVILDTNNSTSDVAPALPAGWLGTENASGITQLTVVASKTPLSQDFGLFNGSRLTGTVFADTGVGTGGIPNNGVKDGTEAGFGSVSVVASSGGSAVASATTAGDGSFTLWVPASVSASVTITPTTPNGYQPTSGSAGTTGGTYTRPALSYTPVAGTVYGNVGFGLAPPSSLAPNGAQTAQPDSAVFYAHTFVAGTGGQVTFALSGAASPANSGWNAVLYQDSNCNGALDSGEPMLGSALTVTAGQQVCVIVKQFVPAGITAGAQNTETLTASFTYTNANPALSATLTVTDVTTGGEPNALALKKLVANVTKASGTSTSVNAAPGDVLQYTLTAQNNGATPLSTLVINDATPAFTTYTSAACPGTLPSGITACSVSTQPAVGGAGGLQWTFTGTLAAGAQVAVTYQVKVSQ